jgi:adenylylsulfate kinase
VERLDGDTVRGMFPGTGFGREERNEHVRRIGFLASTLERHGVFVVASFISPYQDSREFVRGLCRRFVEVFVDTPLEECERRDVKGLYARARRGEVPQFTGISDPYEPPVAPELTIDTTSLTPDGAAQQVFEYLWHHPGR